jgi:UrcA family protein
LATAKQPSSSVIGFATAHHRRRVLSGGPQSSFLGTGSTEPKEICVLRFLAVLAMMAAGPASAQTVSIKADPVHRRSVEVRSDDLDLSREADARQMLARLGVAADRACGGRPPQNMHPAEAALAADYRQCRDRALAAAAAALKSPALDRLIAKTAKGGSRLAKH